jgi:anti-sigma28 factor (negative regulator of flagellin synthesis)
MSVWCDLSLDGINFYNFGWRDHQTTNFDIILKILKSIDYCLDQGQKIAVHCHAGRGRTALIICAYLIFSIGFTANEAIKHFKDKRYGSSLSSSSQKNTLRNFEICSCQNLILDLKEQQKIFYQIPRLTLSQIITVQMSISSIERNEETRRSPKLIKIILQWLTNLLTSHAVRAEKMLAGFADVNNEMFHRPWDDGDEQQLEAIKQAINSGEFSINKQVDTRLMSQLVLDFLEELVEPAISEVTVQKLSVLVGQGMKSHEIISNTLENHGSVGVFEKVQTQLTVAPVRVNKNELVLLNCFKGFLSDVSALTGNKFDGAYLDGAVDR